MALRQITLGDRDMAILRHVLRYRISTPAALQRIFKLTPDAEIALCKRLIEGGFLDQKPLFQRRKYYHLTPKAAVHLGQDEKIGRALSGQQAAVDSYGILAFCCLGPTLRERILRHEFIENFPQFVIRGVPSDHYYWDRDAAGLDRLGLIRVDHGGEVRRIAKKVMIDVAKRAATPAFRDLLLSPNRGFLIAIVTTNPDKSSAIRKTIETEYPDSRAGFRIEVAEGLDVLVERRQARLLRKAPTPG